MSDWFLNLPVLWMAVVVLGAVYVMTAAIYMVVTAFAVQERARALKAISPGMLPIRHLRVAGWISSRAGLERRGSRAWGREPGGECPACGGDPCQRVSGRDRHARTRSRARPY